jgi:hypothetical protein
MDCHRPLQLAALDDIDATVSSGSKAISLSTQKKSKAISFFSH